jgi:starch synthase (maltosyl-transferring)
MSPSNRAGDGRRRAVIENVRPAVDGGRFPIKRTSGESVVVEADVFTDGHDQLYVMLRHKRSSERDWNETRMVPIGNDRWSGAFQVEGLGGYVYTILAWVDRFLSWRTELSRRVEPADVSAALAAGAAIVESAALRAPSSDAQLLREYAERLGGDEDLETRKSLALEPELAELMFEYADRSLATAYGTELGVIVDRKRARHGAWYELFPRSFGGFRECDDVLDYVAELGFDTLYLPPIHPIGETNRKGANNALRAKPGEPGSPWAIGGAEGGHKAIHPDLGTLEDFRSFVASAKRRGLEVALDIAFQCSPDHPYVREHPDWFSQRPDGTIQYAENPPKRYEDIYPFNFETPDWEALWQELLSVFLFWVEQDVRIFRVDNPHTKPLPFWEWVTREVRDRHPDVIFLSEAFTRPKVMHRLAKLGFTQSYTYFTWRNTKPELIEYMRELVHSEGREYFRPNLWPNTPDILNEYLQFGGRPAFITRLVLAATMGANYGVYGPAFELAEATPREVGSEEYRESEKYQARQWDLDRADSLRHVVARVNRIRRENPALHWDWNLRFHAVDNEELICFSKTSPDRANVIVVVVNLDPHHRQSGWLTLSLDELGLADDDPYQMHDLLTGSRYLWHGPRNYVELDAQLSPAHIFRLRRRLRTERDFAYYF